MQDRKTILITGAYGFMGRNLVARLQCDDDVELLLFGTEQTGEDLYDYLGRADFIFHLAGVNRPDNDEDFQTHNVVLTATIVRMLGELDKRTPIVYPSSIHAVSNTPYGKSKKESEQILFEYSNVAGADVFIYRLPNTFGKWGKPNYNSVVATFCHNLGRGLSIKVNDPDCELSLIYIDDVIDMLIITMTATVLVTYGRFQFIPNTVKITLKTLADTIYTFRDSRKSCIVQDMGNDLIKNLYSTYLSYLPDTGLSYKADMKVDNRGWLFELIKSPHIGQVFVSQTKPGITRGGHYHHTKVEKFAVVQGQAIIRLRQIGSDEIIEYEVCDKQIKIVDIPPGYTHDITNTGDTDLITLFWACELFDPDNPDTYYMKVEE